MLKLEFQINDCFTIEDLKDIYNNYNNIDYNIIVNNKNNIVIVEIDTHINKAIEILCDYYDNDDNKIKEHLKRYLNNDY